MEKLNSFIVTGHPVSDIGKGWVTSSIASLLDKPAVIKIDPMLEMTFPGSLGRKLPDGSVVTDDSLSYNSQGIAFEEKQNIMMGKAVLDALVLPTNENGVIKNETSKRTWADIAYHAAQRIKKVIDEIGARSFVIEVGGCPDDRESSSIPLVVRHLKQRFSAEIGIIIVTKYDTAQGKNGIEFKTRGPVRAIETTMAQYWGMPLQTCFVRRDQIPEDISDKTLEDGTKKVAFKAGVSPSSVIYLPNVSHINDLRSYTSKALFSV